MRRACAWLVLVLGRGIAVIVGVLSAIAFVWAMGYVVTEGISHAYKMALPTGLFAFTSWAWKVSRRPLRRAWHDASARPFILVLRPFREEDRNVHEPEVLAFRTSFTTVIDELDAHVKRAARLLALRTPGRRATRIVASEIIVRDDRWKEVVADLVMRSAWVFVLASRTDAIRWELETALGEPFWRKTTVIIPPVVAHGDGDRDTQWKEHAARWDLVANIAARIAAPKYERDIAESKRSSVLPGRRIPVALTALPDGGVEQVWLSRDRDEEAITAREYRLVLQAALPFERLRAGVAAAQRAPIPDRRSSNPLDDTRPPRALT